MSLREAQILTLRVLKQVMEETLDHHNVQLAQVGHQILRFLLLLTNVGRLQRPKDLRF
jgi:hypothetical protein